MLLAVLAGCSAEDGVALVEPQRVAPTFVVRALASHPHDPASFTQGVAIRDGILYESSGGQGTSTLRKVDLATGEELQRIPVPAPHFAEGLAILGDSLIQITWQNRTAYVYDIESLAPLGTFTYRGDGWGLTTDGQALIMSDGSHVIRFLDPVSFAEIRQIEVRDGSNPVRLLNELEWIDGEIWANVWPDDVIVRIDPISGRVLAWLEVGDLAPEIRYRNQEAVPNGIALDPESGRIYMTGKLWPEMFEVEVLPARDGS
jgi:glutaminyl-peptide cyclotransferase